MRSPVFALKPDEVVGARRVPDRCILGSRPDVPQGPPRESGRSGDQAENRVVEEPFVESAFPPRIVAFPARSVNVPPASSMIGLRAAQSQVFIWASTITSARPRRHEGVSIAVGPAAVLADHLDEAIVELAAADLVEAPGRGRAEAGVFEAVDRRDTRQPRGLVPDVPARPRGPGRRRRARRLREPDDAEDGLVVLLESDEGAEQRHAPRERLGAVDRVEDPGAPAPPARLALFFPEDRIVGEARLDALPQEPLPAAVGLGDRRPVGLRDHLEAGRAEELQRQRARLARDLHGEFEAFEQLVVGHRPSVGDRRTARHSLRPPRECHNRAVAQKTLVVKLERGQQEKLRERLAQEGYDFRSLDHAWFSARGGGVVATLYKSGKLVVQGGEVDLFAARFLEGTAPAPAKSEPAAVGGPLVGSDETGKGDYFGPLVVVALRLEPEQRDEVARAGVMDSKKLTDERALQLGPALQGRYPCAIEVLEPEAYNAEYARVGNLNELLADLHARAIRRIVKPGMAVLVDRFASESLLRTRLADLDLRLRQEPRAERELAVAAASIVARQVFLEGLAALSDEAAVDLHKGAGPPVDRAARRYVEIHGRDALGRVAKLHFKNTKKLEGGGSR